MNIHDSNNTAIISYHDVSVTNSAEQTHVTITLSFLIPITAYSDSFHFDVPHSVCEYRNSTWKEVTTALFQVFSIHEHTRLIERSIPYRLKRCRLRT